MWFVEHPMPATLAAAIFIAALACGTFFLLGRTLPGRQAGALVVSAIVTIGAAIVLSAGLNHVWEATRDRGLRPGLSPAFRDDDRAGVDARQ